MVRNLLVAAAVVGSRVSQSVFPVLTSNARNTRLKSPTNATPPAVDMMPVRNGLRCWNVHTGRIVSVS